MYKILDIIIVALLILLLYLAYSISNKNIKEKYRVTAIKQASSKIRYFKEVEGEKVNINKVELEDLIKKYDVVIEIEGD